MITPLKKHRGQNGAIAGLFVLVSATAVVLTTHPRPPGPSGDAAGSKMAAAGANAQQRFTATEATVPRPPERIPLATLAPGHGVKAVVVREVAFRRNVKAAGVVAFDEKRTSHVYAPVRGWVQKLHVKAIGRRVRAGEPLVTLHSDEVHAAEVDLIAQVRSFRTQELLDVERRRLARWGMSKAMIDGIERTGDPTATLPLVAPRTGTVVALQAMPGQFVDPALRHELLTITDPAHVWVFADLAEADAARVPVGQRAKLTIKGVARPVTAKVAYVYRGVDDGMRKVRFDVHSPRAVLAPEAPVKVELQLDLERGLAIPASAVIDAGAHPVVYVMHPENFLQARDVTLGARVGDFYRVEAGLVAGDVVALGAQALVEAARRPGS